MSDLAERLIAVLTTHDVEATRELLAPDLVHWLNLGEQEQGADGLLAVMARERACVRDTEVRLRRRHDTGAGFVLQLDVDGTTVSGRSFHIPVCLVVETDGERITRIDEYADSAAARPLIAEVVAT